MTIHDLHAKLLALGVSDDKYHLHGLYGSVDDNEKPSMNIKAGKRFQEFEVYFKERGSKLSSRIFTNEDEACRYFLRDLGFE